MSIGVLSLRCFEQMGLMLTSKSVLLDHKDSVTCVSFSHDGKLVATGDMSGVIQVWQVAMKSKLWSFETSDLAVS